MTEYGRVLRNGGQRQGTLNLKGPRDLKQEGKDKVVVRAIPDVASIPLPHLLTVDSAAAFHNRHDEWSDKIADLPQGHRLIPIAETTAGNVQWYMVKTHTGLVGWVKSAHIKEAAAPNGKGR